MAGATISTAFCRELLIDGQLLAGAGADEPILNPANGEVLTQIAEASSEQVGRLLDGLGDAEQDQRALLRCGP